MMLSANAHHARSSRPIAHCLGVTRQSSTSLTRSRDRLERLPCRNSAAVTYPTDVGEYAEEPEQPSTSGRRQWSEQEEKQARLRGKVFLTLSMALATPLFCVMFAMFPFVWLFDRSRRRAEHFMNKIWAQWSTCLFNRVTVRSV